LLYVFELDLLFCGSHLCAAFRLVYCADCQSIAGENAHRNGTGVPVDRSTPDTVPLGIMPRTRAPIQTATLTIRCYDHEKKAVRKAAKTLKISLAEFIRATLMAKAKRIAK
jgi:hypothetical protein